MIVVDVGCMPHGNEESVERLIDRFFPYVLFGFDPHPELFEGIYDLRATAVVQRRAAAWTCAGSVPVARDGIRTGVERAESARTTMAEAIDLPAFIDALPRGEIVLKLDCEGAEYPILHALRERDLDKWLFLVLVEWHDGQDPSGDFYGHGWDALGRPELRCPVEEW